MKGVGKVFTAQPQLLDAQIITIETDSEKGMHAFSIVGLPDKAVEEARDRVGAALKNIDFSSPRHSQAKTVVSLSPADVKKEGPAFDVPIALSYLLAREEISFDPAGKLFIGELSLDGSVRRVQGVLPAVKSARDNGFTEAFVPFENLEEAALIDGISVYGMHRLQDLIAHVHVGKMDPPIQAMPLEKPSKKKTAQKKRTHETLLEDIRGHNTAKRALEIAAAGGHNVAFFGPPGTGKTMLASALASLLPDLTPEEIIEVTSIHSVAGVSDELITHAPFRSPHHTSSYVALVGGGTFPKPGEVTLAHRGVLFLDEMPEFDKRVINALRQPLEDGIVSISRAKSSAKFPSRFILVAALNPCPCGYGEGPRCTCSASAIIKYKNKISGPIMDRIDMWIEVLPIDHTELMKPHIRKPESAAARERIVNARTHQLNRFKQGSRLNAHMSARGIAHHIPLSDKQQKLIATSATRLGLSSRAIHRLLKLARTIADLDNATEITDAHILEALQYRPKSK